MIKANKINKEFGNGKGIFDISFEIKRGEVFGFIGPNGAGKSTTIRHLMGFVKPDSGTMRVNNIDCIEKSHEFKSNVGYLPGEIVFPRGLSAKDMLNLQEDLHKIKNSERKEQLIKRFDLDVNVPIKKMSKGMKQKLAIILTFMCSPEILILDEPSSGLDPLMQRELIKLLEEEKAKGHTIFLSSHIFDEIEDVADRICIIKKGKIVREGTMDEIFENQKSYLIVRSDDEIEIDNNIKMHKKNNGYHFLIENNENDILRLLSKYDVKSIEIEKEHLKTLFENLYNKEDLNV